MGLDLYSHVALPSPHLAKVGPRGEDCRAGINELLDHGQLSMALAFSQLDCASLEVRCGQDEWLNVSAITPISHYYQTSKYYFPHLTDKETDSRG